LFKQTLQNRSRSQHDKSIQINTKRNLIQKGHGGRILQVKRCLIRDKGRILAKMASRFSEALSPNQES